MIKIFSMICMFCIKVKENNMTNMTKNPVFKTRKESYISTGQVMGHPATEPIQPGQMRNVVIAFSLLLGILFHMLLSYFGY